MEDAFRRYAIASVGPYLLLGAAYFYVTLSGLLAAWLFMPVAVFMAVLVVVTYAITAFVKRRVEAPLPAFMQRIASNKVVSNVEGQLESQGYFFGTKVGLRASIRESELVYPKKIYVKLYEILE